MKCSLDGFIVQQGHRTGSSREQNYFSSRKKPSLHVVRLNGSLHRLLKTAVTLPSKHPALSEHLRKKSCFTIRNGPVCSVLHLKPGQKLMHPSQLGAVEETCFGTVLSERAACDICSISADIWTAVCFTDGKTGVFSKRLSWPLKSWRSLQIMLEKKRKEKMLCPQRDSFQLFWQHLKKGGCHAV